MAEAGEAFTVYPGEGADARGAVVTANHLYP